MPTSMITAGFIAEGTVFFHAKNGQVGLIGVGAKTCELGLVSRPWSWQVDEASLSYR